MVHLISSLRERAFLCTAVHMGACHQFHGVSACLLVQLFRRSIAPFTFSLMPSWQQLGQPELLEQLGDNKSCHLGLRLRTSGALKNSKFSTSPGFAPPICHALNTCANATAFGCQILSQKDI